MARIIFRKGCTHITQHSYNDRMCFLQNVLFDALPSYGTTQCAFIDTRFISNLPLWIKMHTSLIKRLNVVFDDGELHVDRTLKLSHLENNRHEFRCLIVAIGLLNNRFQMKIPFLAFYYDCIDNIDKLDKLLNAVPRQLSLNVDEH